MTGSDAKNPQSAITIVDYGIGNLRSVEKAFEAVGAEVVRTDDPDVITQARKLVLPGVGAFGACADELRQRGLVAPVKAAVEQGTPLLGVCVGMQLLFEESEEMGRHEGLGLIPGRVVRFDFSEEVGVSGVRHPASVSVDSGLRTPDSRRKIPHMGWNTAAPTRPDPLLEGLPGEPFFYFVHSYHARPEDPADALAVTEYGYSFPAIVRRNNVWGVQFHPEKSAANGLHVLQNFFRSI